MLFFELRHSMIVGHKNPIIMGCFYGRVYKIVQVNYSLDKKDVQKWRNVIRFPKLVCQGIICTLDSIFSIMSFLMLKRYLGH